MADVKISGLPNATTPAAGTEVLPIVQGGQTRQISIANLTAGRAISASSVTNAALTSGRVTYAGASGVLQDSANLAFDGTNLSVAGAGSVTANPPSSTFASLPAASSVTGQIYRVTDVGINGSLWQSNGTTWLPVNGSVVLFKTNIPFYIAPSGTIDATTGVLTLGTALISYQHPGYMYMYFPAGAWTGSTAGWYWVTMSSTTSGLVYSNTYTTGIPTIPSSPTLVTTGAGAYTGVTGSLIAGPNISIPGNVLLNSAALRMNFGQGNNNSAGQKTVAFYINNPASSVAGTLTTTTTEYALGSYTVIQGTAASSSFLRSFSTTSVAGYLSVVNPINLTTSSTIGWSLRINTNATDWVGCLMGTIVLERLS